MYLKKIEMQGFKSFANKMTFEFHQGITGIVGPNGSGKSNVADAVRWVLGEQSAKQLRGGNMQDVIFAGTEARKPQSFAAVSITFDNSDHALETSYEEVTVTRRLYRSGESEYRINNQAVRLRDIHELFYDTGIGKEGYSIIGQGQIERIISGKPDERRELFDEAAGIVKFKRRKAASLKKLAEEQQNLLRVNDILSELTGQLEPLKRQSETARVYLEKKETLKELDINLYLVQDEQAGGRLKELQDKIEVTDAQLSDVDAQLLATKSEYDAIENELQELEQTIAELTEKNQKNLLAREQLRGQIDLLKEQINTVHLNSEHYSQRRNAIREDLEKRGAELAECREKLSELSGKLGAARAEEKKEEKKYKDIEQRLASCNDGITRAKNDVIGMLNSRSTVKGKMQRYGALLEQIDIRRAELQSRMLRFTEEEQAAREKMALATENLNGIRGHIEALRAESAVKEGRVAKLQDELHDANTRLDDVQTRYHRDNSRLDSLRTLNEHYEGYGNAIRRVMEQKKKKPGIHGVVADLISTEKKYEIAIETALGGSIRNIITDNENTAKYFIEYLKQNKYGRATFLPLTNVRPRKNAVRPEVLSEEGVIGLASDLTTCEEIYTDLRSQLLGRTVVVDTIDHAIRLGKKYQHTLYMVTLAGESFSPGGTMTGGAFRNKENLLGRKREIEELDQEVGKLSKEIDEITAGIEEKRTERNALRDEIVRIGNKLHGESIRENTAQMSIKQAEDQIRMNRLDRSALDRENQEIDEQVRKIKESSRSIEEELQASEAAEQKLTEKTGELEEKAAKLVEERDARSSTLASIRLNIQALTQEQGFISSNMDRISEEIESLRAEDAEIGENLIEDSREAEEKQANIVKIGETIRAAEEEASENLKEQTALAARKTELSESHRNFFARRDELSETKTALDRESFRLHSQKEKIEEALDVSISYLWEEYEMTPVQARKFRNPEHRDIQVLKREIAKVKDGIKKLGSVNVNAIEDYKNLVERHTFLSAQHTDLVESEKTLEGIIAELDRGMRRQFNEKFAEISREFDRTFRALFGGGSGRLEIDREMDVLEASITIIAEPPGKKLQNMMQLSGGEKALTAIALLFAIQNLKPSPFCLLDEIEAALDDHNVIRFAEYLHKLTKNTQFIVITHRRGTMSSADRLYGITMQEKGVSTLVSVNLIEDKLSS